MRQSKLRKSLKSLDAIEAPTTMDETQPSRIFSFTEVTLPALVRQMVAPTIKKAMKQSFRPKSQVNKSFSKLPNRTFSAQKLKKNQSNITLKDFYSRNLTPSTKPISAQLQGMIDNIHTKIEQQIIIREFSNKAASPIELFNTIQELERSKNVQSELHLFQSQVIARKNLFNQLHHKFLNKTDQLALLQRQVNIQEIGNKETIDLTSIVQNRENELEDLIQGYNNEKFYQGTLIHMLHSRKYEVIILSQPINSLKREIERVSGKIREEEFKNTSLYSKITLNKRSCSSMEERIEGIKKERERKRTNDLKLYEDKHRFWHCIEYERDRNSLLEKQKANAKQLMSLEEKLEKLKEIEAINEELQKVEKLQKKEENKFRNLQKRTNLVSAEDMYPYFQYLRSNENKLKKLVQSQSERIETLLHSKEEMTRELKRLKFFNKAQTMKNKEFDMLEDNRKSQTKNLIDNEFNLAKLEQLVASASSCISRIVFQLFDDREKTSGQHDFLTDSLAKCEVKLKNMLQNVTEKGVMFLDESVNTVTFTQAVEYSKPPGYLHLNTQYIFAHKKEPETDVGTLDNHEEDSLREKLKWVEPYMRQLFVSKKLIDGEKSFKGDRIQDDQPADTRLRRREGFNI